MTLVTLVQQTAYPKHVPLLSRFLLCLPRGGGGGGGGYSDIFTHT